MAASRENIAGGGQAGYQDHHPNRSHSTLEDVWGSEERQDKINNETGSPVNTIKSTERLANGYEEEST